MSTSFPVSDVEPGDEVLATVKMKASLEERTQAKVEACGSNLEGLVEVGAHPFVEAALQAFAGHLPLVLSPDDVWLCLAQGFGTHVNLDAEALRERFVSHQGRAKLVVVHNSFLKGSPDNDWPGVFAELSDLIGGFVGIAQDPDTVAVRPAIGWAVRHAQDPEPKAP